jgi:hypothetical protein
VKFSTAWFPLASLTLYLSLKRPTTAPSSGGTTASSYVTPPSFDFISSTSTDAASEIAA